MTRVELTLHNKRPLLTCNKTPEAYSEHSQAFGKERLLKSYQLKEVGGS